VRCQIAGVQYEKRVSEKDLQIRSSLSGSLRPREVSSSSDNMEENANPAETKRAKTECSDS
jgi:hypothetical protein